MNPTIKYDAEHFDPPAPVARISVANASTGMAVIEVPMLLDSGADVTLLPADIIAPLELAAEGEQILQGYDGDRSAAPVVRALVTWGKFTFKGQYVVAAADVGILGRDVLNHLRLTLDGPALAYEVTHSAPPG